MKSFDIPLHYRSELISAIKSKRKSEDRMKKDFQPTQISAGDVNIYLARHFGFCYGVENAIEVSFRAVAEHPDRRIFLLSEIIHNPMVNDDLLSAGVRFIMDTSGHNIVDWDEITPEDIIIIPAFGTTVEIEKIITDKNLHTETYTSTCPFVEKVWNKAEQIGNKGYTVIIHGKPEHEESKATFSHSKENAPSLIIRNLEEAQILAQYMKGERDMDDFYTKFADAYSSGFDPLRDLQKIGVVNQTTMLASETQEISDFLRQTQVELHIGDDLDISEYFADTRDTLCYATNDNQSAVLSLNQIPADLAVVVGGYNSSNTSHLFEILDQSHKAIYIKNDSNIKEDGQIDHWNFKSKELESREMPSRGTGNLNFLVTSGASCPDIVVEDVVRRIFTYYGLENEFSQWRENYLAATNH